MACLHAGTFLLWSDASDYKPGCPPCAFLGGWKWELPTAGLLALKRLVLVHGRRPSGLVQCVGAYVLSAYSLHKFKERTKYYMWHASEIKVWLVPFILPKPVKQKITL